MFCFPLIKLHKNGEVLFLNLGVFPALLFNTTPEPNQAPELRHLYLYFILFYF